MRCSNSSNKPDQVQRMITRTHICGISTSTPVLGRAITKTRFMEIFQTRPQAEALPRTGTLSTNFVHPCRRCILSLCTSHCTESRGGTVLKFTSKWQLLAVSRLVEIPQVAHLWSLERIQKKCPSVCPHDEGYSMVTRDKFISKRLRPCHTHQVEALAEAFVMVETTHHRVPCLWNYRS